MRPISVLTPVFLVILAASIASQSVVAQGTVLLNNRVAGQLVTHVFWMSELSPGLVQAGNGPNDIPQGTTDWASFAALSGSGFTAQLWVANGADQPEATLQPAFPTTTFRTGQGSGWVIPTTVTLPGVPEGGSATVALRIWDNQCGTVTNWIQARNLPVAHGQSSLFNVCCVGGGIMPPANLTGLRSFNLGGCLGPYFMGWLTQPSNQEAVQGGTAIFEAKTLACPTASYQWYHDGAPITSNALCTCYSLQMTNVQLSDTGNYWAIITARNADGSMTNSMSAVATLIVHPLPTITSQPAGQTVYAGQDVDFDVVAEGVPPLTYQWFFYIYPITNGLSSHLHMSKVQMSQSGSYSVVVNSPYGSVTSAPAILSVRPPPPSIVPSAQTAEVGSTVTFRILLQGDNAPFQSSFWLFNVTNRFQASTPDGNLFLRNVQLAQAGVYAFVASNSGGIVASVPAQLNVIPPVLRKQVLTVISSGPTGSQIELEYADSLNPSTTWIPVQPNSPGNGFQWHVEMSNPLPTERYYRARQSGDVGNRPRVQMRNVSAIMVTGRPGDSFRVDSINQIGPIDDWVSLGSVTLSTNSGFFYDPTLSGSASVLYRIVPLP